MNAARDLPLLAAWRLRVPARPLRALARGDQAPLRLWLAQESALRLAEARRDAYLDLAALEDLGARLIVPNVGEWPAGLRDLRDPPAFLAVRGIVPSSGIAVIGARDASERACDVARALAARMGVPVIAGLAAGIDAAAHRGALDAGVPTVAYVGSGLARTSPPEHAALADEIVANGGAIATEQPPEDAATAWTLRRRDRLQAAHARAVVLIESPGDGGAMHTMNYARELGRPRFALQSDATGNQQALHDGATALPWDVEEAWSCIRTETADR